MVRKPLIFEEVMRDTVDGMYPNDPERAYDTSHPPYDYYFVELPEGMTREELQAHLIVESVVPLGNVSLRQLRTDPPLIVFQARKDPSGLDFKLASPPMTALEVRKRIAELDAEEDISEDDKNVLKEVRVLVSDLSRKLAELVAENPKALMELEWRDVERLVAEVFDGLGFQVELTPPSNDGGKDVILSC